jgi:hypothetical protein
MTYWTVGQVKQGMVESIPVSTKNCSVNLSILQRDSGHLGKTIFALFSLFCCLQNEWWLETLKYARMSWLYEAK